MPLGALGSQGPLLEVTLAALWLPWDAGGSHLDTLGSQAQLLVTLVKNKHRVLLEASAMFAYKRWLGWVHTRHSPDQPRSRQNVSRAAAPTSPSRLPGDKMT